MVVHELCSRANGKCAMALWVGICVMELRSVIKVTRMKPNLRKLLTTKLILIAPTLGDQECIINALFGNMNSLSITSINCEVGFCLDIE